MARRCRVRRRTIDASSGEQIRHRLCRAGERRINRVLHIMAFVNRATTPKDAAGTGASKLAVCKRPLWSGTPRGGLGGGHQYDLRSSVLNVDRVRMVCRSPSLLRVQRRPRTSGVASDYDRPATRCGFTGLSGPIGGCSTPRRSLHRRRPGPGPRPGLHPGGPARCLRRARGADPGRRHLIRCKCAYLNQGLGRRVHTCPRAWLGDLSRTTRRVRLSLTLDHGQAQTGRARR